MGINVGGVDIVGEIVELNFQLRRTQRLLEIVLGKGNVLGGTLTARDLELAEKDALEFVQNKFPDMGIHKKG